MELKDSFALGIALYGAVLSTYLAIKSYIDGRAKLKFVHMYDLNEKYMNIIITNLSTKAVNIIKGEYFIGKGKTPQTLNIKLPTTIEPEKSIVVQIHLDNKDKYFENVDEFVFTSSTNTQFHYRMDMTIGQDLKYHLYGIKSRQLFFAMETISDNFDALLDENKKIFEEVEKDYQLFKGLEEK